MPTLDWIGKKAVTNHHREIPFRLLKCDEKLSVGDPGSGNLLVQGDNLHALKALLPYYAGQVKCIYIDPPYNTGNENWVYNDAVNSPEIRRWLGQVVGAESEDLSRHDKWLCMVYPRLALLREFLTRDGAIFVSIDDNEVAPLRLVLDEIYGPNNFCAQVTVQCNPKGRVLAQQFAKTHEYLLVYSRFPGGVVFETPKTLDNILSEYDEVSPDGRRFRALELRNTHRQFNKQTRPNLHYPLYAKPESGEVQVQKAQEFIEIWPNWPDGMLGCWTWDRTKCAEEKDDLVARCVRGNWKVFRKAYATGETGEAVTKKPKSIWMEPDIQTEKGQKQIDHILGGRIFYAPKALALVSRCVELVTKPGDLVLDSFAGSGTTGHAVLAENKAKGGSRRFILVEMDEAICQRVTAQRIRKAVEGYDDMAGLGGGFRYCTLGTPLFDETGNINSEVKFADLAAHVYFSETGEPLPKAKNGKSPLLGVHNGIGIYLLYNGILGDKTVDGGNVLTGPILQSLPTHDGPRVIYGEGCRLSAARLRREGITFRQLPYEIKVT